MPSGWRDEAWEYALSRRQDRRCGCRASRRRSLDEALRDLERNAGDLLKAVSASGILLGWSQDDLGNLNIPLKAAGLLISIFALALGAPFWFEILQKLVSIRSVGKSLAERGAGKVGAAY